MRTQILILILSLFPLMLSAQIDPEAVKVLSEFGNKATSAPSVMMDFKIVTYDSKEDYTDKRSGSVVISGDRYRLTLDDYNIWTDGEVVWNYLADVNEVTITETDPEDQSFISKPSLLFSLFEEGYKVRMVEQSNAEWIIDLYPEEISTDLIRLRLAIGKSSYDLRSAEYKTKEGITITLTPDKYDLGFKPDSGYFTFKPGDYKGIEIVDMR